MILGIAHMIMSIKGIENASTILSNDAECKFSARNIPNNVDKTKLLNKYNPVHDIALYRSSQYTAPIEFIDHGSIEESQSGPYSVDISSITLTTKNINQELEFWKSALNFKQWDEPNGLTYTSPVPSWNIILKMKQDTNAKAVGLDAKGFTCMALYVKNIALVSEKAKAHGALNMTKIFEQIVEDRIMNICMFQTPSGANIELIEMINSGKRKPL